MAVSLMEKLTNFLMPLEEEGAEGVAAAPAPQRAAHLTVHEGAAKKVDLSISIVVPGEYADACAYADLLLQQKALLVNFSRLEAAEQQSIVDFLDGVCAVSGGTSLLIQEQLLLYADRKSVV